MVPKGYTYGLVTVCALAAVLGAPSGPCPNREPVSSNIVLLPDTVDCSVYYNCSVGDLVRETCPPSLVFDSGAQTCRPPTADGCRPPETQAQAPATRTVLVTRQESTTDSTVSVVTKPSPSNTAAKNFTTENVHLKSLGNGTEDVMHSVFYDHWNKENISYPSTNFTENVSTKEEPISLEVIPFSGSGVPDTHTATESVRLMYNFSEDTYYDSRTESMPHKSPQITDNRLREFTKHALNSSLTAPTTYEPPTSRASANRLAQDSSSSYTQFVDEAFNTVTTTQASPTYTFPIILSNYSFENSNNRYEYGHLIQPESDMPVSSTKYHTTRDVESLVLPTTEGSTHSKNYKPLEIPIKTFPQHVIKISSYYEEGTTDSNPINIPTKQSDDFTYQDVLGSTNVDTWTAVNVQDQVSHTQYPEFLHGSTHMTENYISNPHEPENYFGSENISVPREITPSVVSKSDKVHATSYSTNQFSIQTENVERKKPVPFFTLLSTYPNAFSTKKSYQSEGDTERFYQNTPNMKLSSGSNEQPVVNGLDNYRSFTRNNGSELLQKYFPSIYSIQSTTVSPYMKHGVSTKIISHTPRELPLTSETAPRNHLTNSSLSVESQTNPKLFNPSEVILPSHLTTFPSIMTNTILSNITKQLKINPIEPLGVKHVNMQSVSPSVSTLKYSITQQKQLANGSISFAKKGYPNMSDHSTAAFLSNSTVTSILSSTKMLPSLSVQSPAATSAWLGTDTANPQSRSFSDLTSLSTKLPLNETAYDSVNLVNQSSQQSSFQSEAYLREPLSVGSVVLTTRRFNETLVPSATQSTFSHLPLQSAADQTNEFVDVPHNLRNQHTLTNSNIPVQHAEYLIDHSANLSVPINDNIKVSMQSPADLFTEPFVAANNQLVADYTTSPIVDPDQITTQRTKSDYKSSTTKQSVFDSSVLSSQVLMDSNFQSSAASKTQPIVVTEHVTTQTFRNMSIHSAVVPAAEPTRNVIEFSLNNTRTFSNTNYSSHFLETTKVFTHEIDQNLLPTRESIIPSSQSSEHTRILTETYQPNFSQNSEHGSAPNVSLANANRAFIPQSFSNDNNFTTKFQPFDLRTPIQVIVRESFLTDTIMSPPSSRSPLYVHNQDKFSGLIDSQNFTKEVDRKLTDTHTPVSLSLLSPVHDHNLALTYQSAIELQNSTKVNNPHVSLTGTFLPSSSQSPVPNLTKTEWFTVSKNFMESVYTDRFITRTSMNITAKSPVHTLNMNDANQPFELRNSTEATVAKNSLIHTFKTSPLSNAYTHKLSGTDHLTDLHNSTQGVELQLSLTETFLTSSPQSIVDVHSFITMDQHFHSQQKNLGDNLNLSIAHASIPTSPQSYTHAQNLVNTEQRSIASQNSNQGDALNFLLTQASIFTSPQTPVNAQHLDKTDQSTDARNSAQRVYSELSIGNTYTPHPQSLVYAQNLAKTDRPLDSRNSTLEFDPKLSLTQTSMSPFRQSHRPSYDATKSDQHIYLRSTTQGPYPKLSLINMLMTSPPNSPTNTHRVNKPGQPLNSQNIAKRNDQNLSLVHTSIPISPKPSVHGHSPTTINQAINSESSTQGIGSGFSLAYVPTTYPSQSPLHAYSLLEADKTINSRKSIEKNYTELSPTNSSGPPPHSDSMTKTDRPIDSRKSNSKQGVSLELLLSHTRTFVSPTPQKPAHSHKPLNSLISSQGLVTELSSTSVAMPSSTQSHALAQNVTKIDHPTHSQQSTGMNGTDFLVTHTSMPHSPQLPVHSHDVANYSGNNLLYAFVSGTSKVYSSTGYKNTVQNANTANTTFELPTTTFFQTEDVSVQIRKDSLATVAINPASKVPFAPLVKHAFDFPLSVKNDGADNTSNSSHKLSIDHSGWLKASSGSTGDNFSYTSARNLQISTDLTSDDQVTDKFSVDLFADTTADSFSQTVFISTTAPDVSDPGSVASAAKSNRGSVHRSTVSAKFHNNNGVKGITSSSSPIPLLVDYKVSVQDTTSQDLSELSHNNQTLANRSSAATERGANTYTLSIDSSKHGNSRDTQMQINFHEKGNVENPSSVNFKESTKISEGTTEKSRNGYSQSIINSMLSYLISLINAFSTSELGISTVNQPKDLVDYESDDSILIAKNPQEIPNASLTAELERVTKPRVIHSQPETTVTKYFSDTTKANNNEKKVLNNEVAGKNVGHEMKAFNSGDDTEVQESEKKEETQRKKKTSEEVNESQEQRQDNSGKTKIHTTNRKKRESTEENEEGSNESDSYVKKHMNNGKFHAMFLEHKTRESSDETDEDSNSEEKRHIKRGKFRALFTSRKEIESGEGSKETSEDNESSGRRNKMRRKFEGRMATHKQREETVESKDTSEDSDSTMERYINRGKFKVHVTIHKRRESSESSSESSDDSDSF